MDLRTMPKIELHCHLDGSLRPETVREWLIETDGEAPDLEAVAEALIAPESCDSLDTYLERFHLPVRLMQSKARLTQAAYEVMADAAAEGVVYQEIRFAPQLHTKAGLSYAEIIKAVVDGVRKAEGRFPIAGNVILSYMRFSDEAGFVELIDAGEPFLKKGVVAVDLCAGENDRFALRFKNAVPYAKSLGYEVTIHAGETGSFENIIDAVLLLEASRIGHGVAMWQSPEARELVKARGVTIECCPTSNLQTQAVSTIDAHPVEAFREAGIAVTLNTDNRTVSNTTMTGEFKKTGAAFGWSEAAYEALYMAAVDACFADEVTKATLRGRFFCARKH